MESLYSVGATSGEADEPDVQVLGMVTMKRVKPSKDAVVARRRRPSRWVIEGRIEVSTEPDPLLPEERKRRVLLALGNLVLKLQELDAKKGGGKQG